jgi:pimeloyl-ACP methyl ester carboxylesterase
VDDHFSLSHQELSSTALHAQLGRAVTVGDCFAMFHPGQAAEGIVILPPFGHEALASAKPLRLLAQALSGAGYPVLRLDFPGTGDSIGEENLTGMVESRLTAAREAISWMKRTAGVSEVSLVGVRLGGSIALKVAEQASLNRLLLIAPVLSCKTYLRELQQMRSHYAVGGLAKGESENEFNGFTISDVSLAQLRTLDLRKASATGWKSAAFMMPEGLGAANDLVQTWQAAGKDAEVINHCALQELLTDPALGVKPTELVQLSAGWFGEPASSATPVFAPFAAARLSGEGFSETSCRFGENGLFGILCRPCGAGRDAPALILPNTGANPRSGWGRQTTELARSLAREGYTTFRMDLAGIGESPDVEGRPERVVYVEQVALDVLAAVDYLKSIGFERPAIAGICSGAYAVFHAARGGADISGALLINLQKFHWREGDSFVLYNSVDSYVAKLFTRAAWERVLKGDSNIRGVLRTLLRRLSTMAQARFSGLFARKAASANSSAAAAKRTPREDIETLLARGVVVSVQFTRGDGGIDEMRSHLGNNGSFVRFRGAFDFAIIDGADHNFSTEASREKLLPAVRRLMDRLTAVR